MPVTGMAFSNKVKQLIANYWQAWKPMQYGAATTPTSHWLTPSNGLNLSRAAFQAVLHNLLQMWGTWLQHGTQATCLKMMLSTS